MWKPWRHRLYSNVGSVIKNDVDTCFIQFRLVSSVFFWLRCSLITSFYTSTLQKQYDSNTCVRHTYTYLETVRRRRRWTLILLDNMSTVKLQNSLRCLTWELHCLLIFKLGLQWRVNGQCSSHARLRGCACLSGATLPVVANDDRDSLRVNTNVCECVREESNSYNSACSAWGMSFCHIQTL